MNTDHKTAESEISVKPEFSSVLSRLFRRTIVWLKVRVESNFCLRLQRCNAWQKAVLRLVLCIVGISDFLGSNLLHDTTENMEMFTIFGTWCDEHGRKGNTVEGCYVWSSRLR